MSSNVLSWIHPLRWIRELQWQSHRKDLANIKLLVLDVDGVLTDGGLWVNAQGAVQKRFDVRDGLGLKLLQDAGVRLAFLSGGQGGATEARASQLGIHHCLIGVKDKSAALESLQIELQMSPLQTAFLGDDLNDLAVRQQVNLLLAPADACRPLRRQADGVLQHCGGHGAVRELSERLLQSRGQWHQLQQQGWKNSND